jgi:hypothetical protein
VEIHEQVDSFLHITAETIINLRYLVRIDQVGGRVEFTAAVGPKIVVKSADLTSSAVVMIDSWYDQD